MLYDKDLTKLKILYASYHSIIFMPFCIQLDNSSSKHSNKVEIFEKGVLKTVYLVQFSNQHSIFAILDALLEKWKREWCISLFVWKHHIPTNQGCIKHVCFCTCFWTSKIIQKYWPLNDITSLYFFGYFSIKLDKNLQTIPLLLSRF